MEESRVDQFAGGAHSHSEEDLLEEIAAPLAVAVPTDDLGVARRVKAVAATRPLHDLERNKASWDGGFWDRYELLSVAIAVIDQAALAMGISAGILYEEAVDFAAEQAYRQRPDAHPAEHREVGSRVVAGLVTDNPEEQVWTDYGGGQVVRRTHSFRLLYEQWNADETVHLRASEQAINVLVDALDIDDLESAQVAAETQIRVLIERGAFQSAVSVARQARYRTIQYLERVRNIARDTLVDPDSHDWVDDVPKFLTEALDHVAARVEAESALIQAIEERRSAAAEPEVRRTASQLIAMLADCRRRHSELQRHLLGARKQLRRSQDDRFARGRATVRRANLESDLIEPLLRAAAIGAAAIGEDVLVRFAAPRRLYLPSGAVLLDELLEPPLEPAPGEEVPDPVFEEDSGPPWWEPYWDAADDLVTGIESPIRLSVLLERSRSVAEATLGPEGPLDEAILAEAVCHVAHEHLAQPLLGHDRVTPVICALPTGVALEHPLIEADDLLLVPGFVGAAENEEGSDVAGLDALGGVR